MQITFALTDIDGAERLISDKLLAALEQYDRVLWIITGGSNIPVETAVMRGIGSADSGKLTIALSDERFGPLHHPESNWQQLIAAGFEAKRARVIPVLRPHMALRETCERYGAAFSEACLSADKVVALLGMGADGHIAGILPNSVALNAGKRWTVAYRTAEYTRITLTPFALSHLSEAVLSAFGASKREQLELLRDRRLAAARQPAQLLKAIPKLTVINDQIGE